MMTENKRFRANKVTFKEYILYIPIYIIYIYLYTAHTKGLNQTAG